MEILLWTLTALAALGVLLQGRLFRARWAGDITLAVCLTVFVVLLYGRLSGLLGSGWDARPTVRLILMSVTVPLLYASARINRWSERW